jgi:peptidoglycan/xylan/chitin deacetylase (PgdA/CDA1 family)
MIILIIAVVLILGIALRWLFMSSTSQIFGNFPYKINTSKKMIALSFDDGPNEPYTSQIVDFLNSKNIKATFFQVGKCIERFPDATDKIYKSGHVIGNHSLSHKFHKYFTEPSFQKEIDETQKIIKQQINKEPALFRSPWLWRNPPFLKMLKAKSLQPVSGLFCHFFEPFQPSGERIARRALAKAKPGVIIIFHDGFDSQTGNRSQTVKAVKITIEELIKQGYELVTVDKLLKVPAYH